ncbi:Chorion transcription factor Cf2, partial [Gryllus bimaculatus]
MSNNEQTVLIAMGDIDFLSESIVKIEEVKEEPMDKREDYCWNSIAKCEPGALDHSIKEENNKDDGEMEPPEAMFIEPIEKLKEAFIEETKDLLAARCESASWGTIKTEISSSPGGELHSHMGIHPSGKKIQCSICEKGFSGKRHLEMHMRVHTGEKPFQCSICQRRFSQKGSLDRHMSTHTDEKPFQCSICEKSFNLKGKVVKHMRTHTGEKPY